MTYITLTVNFETEKGSLLWPSDVKCPKCKEIEKSDLEKLTDMCYSVDRITSSMEGNLLGFLEHCPNCNSTWGAPLPFVFV